MDIDLRIILLAIGALFIVGLILVDQIKRKKREDQPYKRFSESNDFELPPMSTTDDTPTHDELDELHIDGATLSEQVVVEDGLGDQPEPETLADPELEDRGVEASHAESDESLQAESPSESDNETQDESENEQEQGQGMVLSLLVLAPKGEQFRGSQIKMALKETGFSYGNMNIFHQMKGGDSVVSVANVLEPGTFEMDDIDALRTPGLVLFAQLPGPHSGGEAFERWYKSARKLKAALSARLTDMHQQPLEKDNIEKLRTEAEGFAAMSQDMDE